jgi:hypothetical protein
MVLLRGIRHLDPQYLATNVREAMCTRLGYRTTLSRLHTLDPVSISLSEEQPFRNSRL